MIKKIGVFFSILFASLTLVLTGGFVFAEGEDSTGDVVDKIDYPCKVVVSSNDGGDVLTDVEEGNVGDIVTVYIKSDFLFSVSSIQINGTPVKIDSDGKYQFELIEGDNIVSVEFKINNEKLTEIANLINGVRENGFQSLFTVSNLLNLISWVISTILGSGFFITLIRSRKLKAKTVDELTELFTALIQSENSKAIKDFLEKLIAPVLDNMTLKIDGINDCIKVFCRCFVLAQDDTPENRLAIISELTNLSNNDEALTAQIRAIVKEEQKAQEEKIVARDKAIEELKKNNQNLVKKEENSDNYGQL